MNDDVDPPKPFQNGIGHRRAAICRGDIRGHK
jgi:hypothetical protein